MGFIYYCTSTSKIRETESVFVFILLFLALPLVARAVEYRRLRWAVAQVKKKIIKKLNTLPA